MHYKEAPISAKGTQLIEKSRLINTKWKRRKYMYFNKIIFGEKPTKVTFYRPENSLTDNLNNNFRLARKIIALNAYS